MNWKALYAAALCSMTLYGGSAFAVAPAEAIPMKQGLHQWPALKGKLILVVGTYQDTTSFRRSYNFYFKDGKDEAWNQVPVRNKAGRMQFEWDSASGAEVTLADGIISPRADAVYFIVADKRADQSYQEKGDITVTWYKLIESGDDMPDDPAYQFKPAFARTYPKSAATVEAILSKELSLQPHK
ncbi:hypothetical protein [Duganella aceris]|uniref:Uncharacterized protein n=1 Tax=Duganella aceris TaxID=2703883 RepID=A0ABX0FSC1_9BURK|nr:hypothetical protein [Duganella aceris]NGZ87440.1 hypothetical protein [Duganella aceris]